MFIFCRIYSSACFHNIEKCSFRIALVNINLLSLLWDVNRAKKLYTQPSPNKSFKIVELMWLLTLFSNLMQKPNTKNCLVSTTQEEKASYFRSFLKIRASST